MNELDILGRTSVVKQVMNILNGLRNNQQSMTFTINGKWGSGKTFVLNLLAEELKRDNEGLKRNKFCYIRYDCWKYDYYAEPLMAMVSAMKDAIENETKVGNTNYVGSELKHTAEDLGKWLVSICGLALKAQCGVDISKILLKIIDDDPEKRHKIFDTNLSLTKAIADLREIIKQISTESVLVIVVDELDRCLPEYMIRVLERLHHLFEGLENVILIVATDREQIEHTIKHIYGEATDAISYLQKMIQFELNLDYGTIKDEVVLNNKFSDYIGMFDEKIISQELKLSEFFQTVFSNMEIRKIIRYVDKITLIHRLVFGDKKPSYAILYLELFLTIVTKEYNIRPTSKEIRIDVYDPFSSYYCIENNNWRDIPLVVYLKEKFSGIHTDKNPDDWINGYRHITIYGYISDLTMLFWYWTRAIEENVQAYSLPRCANIEQSRKLEKAVLEKCEHVKRFKELMMIID